MLVRNGVGYNAREKHRRDYMGRVEVRVARAVCGTLPRGRHYLLLPFFATISNARERERERERERAASSRDFSPFFFVYTLPPAFFCTRVQKHAEFSMDSPAGPFESSWIARMCVCGMRRVLELLIHAARWQIFAIFLRLKGELVGKASGTLVFKAARYPARRGSCVALIYAHRMHEARSALSIVKNITAQGTEGVGRWWRRLKAYASDDFSLS